MLSITELAKKINLELKTTDLINLTNNLFLINDKEINFNKYNNQLTYFKDVVYIDDNIEIIIIYWPPKSSTKIHNHPENGCIVRVLHGILREDIYEENTIIKTNITNGIIIKKHNQFHKITNDQDYQSISIHIYSPPNYYAKSN